MIAAALAALLAAPGWGRVVQVTPRRAYLDAGARQGLVAGMELKLPRGRRCAVDNVSERRASCTGTARAQDRFRLPAGRPAPVPPPRRPPAPLGARELSRRQAALQAVRPSLIEYQRASVETPSAPVRARAGFTHSTWASTTAGPPWQQERVDAVLHAPIAGPARVDLDLSALRWSRRPSSARFRPGDAWQLYVREAALSAAGAVGRVALGRQRPWAPGAALLDGLQAAKSIGSGELSLYAGALSDPGTALPGVDRLAAGLSWQIEGARGRHDGRATVLSLPGGEKRYEVEAGGAVSVGRAFDLTGDVRLAAGMLAPQAGVDALRIDARARLGDSVRITGAFRHQAIPFPADAADAGGSSRHADFAASWDVIDALSLTAVGGYAGEAGSGIWRAFFGPEVAWRKPLAGLATLGAGYLEERGYLRARSAYAQATLLGGRVRASLRGSWMREVNVGDEVGLHASAAARIVEWLELSGSLLGRKALGGDGAGLAATLGARGGF